MRIEKEKDTTTIKVHEYKNGSDMALTAAVVKTRGIADHPLEAILNGLHYVLDELTPVICGYTDQVVYASVPEGTLCLHVGGNKKLPCRREIIDVRHYWSPYANEMLDPKRAVSFVSNGRTSNVHFTGDSEMGATMMVDSHAHSTGEWRAHVCIFRPLTRSTDDMWYEWARARGFRKLINGAFLVWEPVEKRTPKPTWGIQLIRPLEARVWKDCLPFDECIVVSDDGSCFAYVSCSDAKHAYIVHVISSFGQRIHTHTIRSLEVMDAKTLSLCTSRSTGKRRHPRGGIRRQQTTTSSCCLTTASSSKIGDAPHRLISLDKRYMTLMVRDSEWADIVDILHKRVKRIQFPIVNGTHPTYVQFNAVSAKFHIAYFRKDLLAAAPMLMSGDGGDYMWEPIDDAVLWDFRIIRGWVLRNIRSLEPHDKLISTTATRYDVSGRIMLMLPAGVCSSFSDFVCDPLVDWRIFM